MAAPNGWFAVQDALANRFESSATRTWTRRPTAAPRHDDRHADGRHAAVGAPAGRRAAAAAPGGADQCPSGVSTCGATRAWSRSCASTTSSWPRRQPDDVRRRDRRAAAHERAPGRALGVAIVRAVNADGSPRRVFARVNYREDAPRDRRHGVRVRRPLCDDLGLVARPPARRRGTGGRRDSRRRPHGALQPFRPFDVIYLGFELPITHARAVRTSASFAIHAKLCGPLTPRAAQKTPPSSAVNSTDPFAGARHGHSTRASRCITHAKCWPSVISIARP